MRSEDGDMKKTCENHICSRLRDCDKICSEVDSIHLCSNSALFDASPIFVFPLIILNRLKKSTFRMKILVPLHLKE